jgi:hypothetical protein
LIRIMKATIQLKPCELTIFLKNGLIYVFNLLPQFEQNLESGVH